MVKYFLGEVVDKFEGKLYNHFVVKGIRSEMEVEAMLTNFGKICRKLRIDHNELLLDMANYLGVSAAFLSKVENGRAKPPVEWKNSIALHYNLQGKDYNELCNSIEEARNISTLKIPNVRSDDSDLMLEFARRLGNMSDSEKKNLRKKFDI